MNSTAGVLFSESALATVTEACIELRDVTKTLVCSAASIIIIVNFMIWL